MLPSSAETGRTPQGNSRQKAMRRQPIKAAMMDGVFMITFRRGELADITAQN